MPKIIKKSLKVGDVVWFFNSNRREYKKDSKGFSQGAPIYSAHFERFKILEENDKEFVLEHGYAINKKSQKFKTRGGHVIGEFFTTKEKEDKVYLEENSKRVRKAFSYNIYRDAAKLRRIIAILDE